MSITLYKTRQETILTFHNAGSNLKHFSAQMKSSLFIGTFSLGRDASSNIT
jgi:hypothetical protein